MIVYSDFFSVIDYYTVWPGLNSRATARERGPIPTKIGHLCQGLNAGICLTTKVEPHYFELGLFEVPAILNEDRILLDLPLCFQSFTISYFEHGYFEFPVISNSLFFPYTLN